MSSVVIPDLVLEKLVCDFCKLYLSVPPIKVLSSGESVCGRCTFLINIRKNECFSLRQYAYENIANNILFKCKHHHEGCEHLLSFGEVQDHEKTCNFREYNCPVIFQGSCTWYGNAQQMIQHFKSIHNDLLLKNNTVFINIDYNNNQNYLLQQDGFLFVLQVKCDTYEKKIWVCVILIGPSKHASRILYKIQAYGNKCQYIYSENECFTDDTLHFVIMKNNCREINFAHIVESCSTQIRCKININIPEDLKQQMLTENVLVSKKEKLEIFQSKLNIKNDEIEEKLGILRAKENELEEKKAELMTVTQTLEEQTRNIKETQYYIHEKLKYISSCERLQETNDKALQKQKVDLTKKERQLNLRESIIQELQKQIQQSQCIQCDEHQQLMKAGTIQLKILNCLQCKHCLVSPIIPCTNGHVNCIECLGYTKKCSVCKIKQRNGCKVYLLQTIYNKLAFTCRWNSCNKIISSNSIRQHEQSCAWRIYKCIYYLCQWSGTLKDFIQHWDEKHSDKLLHIANEWMTPGRENEWVRYNLLAYREIWNCVISPPYKLGRIINIDYYGPASFISHFRYEVHLQSNSDNSVNIFKVTRVTYYDEYCRYNVIVPMSNDNIIIKIIKT